MAFNIESLKFLIDDFNKKGKRPHGKLLTLSRYRVGFEKELFNRVCQSCGWNIELDGSDKENLLLNDEIVFSALGFEQMDSMDYSKYEGANIIHDLNDRSLPRELENKYDYILDGGTLEHIFHFPNVLENIYKMLKVGGTFFFDVPTFYGFNHGYYNFSPVLFYEYFKANNYEINNIIPYTSKNGFTYVADPIINNIFQKIPVIAHNANVMWGSVTKTAQTTFDVVPNQGTYVNAWNSSSKIIFETFESLDEDKIFVFGTGNYARDMLKMLSIKSRNKIAGFISRDAEEIGTLFYGYKIYKIDEAIELSKTILIATQRQFQDIVYRRIKHLENDGIRIIRPWM